MELDYLDKLKRSFEKYFPDNDISMREEQIIINYRGLNIKFIEIRSNKDGILIPIRELKFHKKLKEEYLREYINQKEGNEKGIGYAIVLRKTPKILYVLGAKNMVSLLKGDSVIPWDTLSRECKRAFSKEDSQELWNLMGLKEFLDDEWKRYMGTLAEKIKLEARGTTQKCSKCGSVVKKSLWNRVHRCEACGLVADRDYNSAVNILNAGAGRSEEPLEDLPLRKVPSISVILGQASPLKKEAPCYRGSSP